MASPLIITIVTRGDDLEHHVPRGFGMVDEMFAEAGFRDTISTQHSDSLLKRLRIVQRALAREFRDGIRVRLINPWTPAGMWLVFRRRLRDFPCILIGDRSYAVNTPVEEIIEAARLALNTDQPHDHVSSRVKGTSE
jgi:hypothetical protein